MIESDSNSEKVCKICYATDADFEGEWSKPCKCNGSIKWVHKECLQTWVENAPSMQKSQCMTCKFPYKRSWSIKPYKKWSWPKLRLSGWDVVEISLDIYSSFKLIKGFFAMLNGTKSVFGQICYMIFWRLFIFNTRRVDYYKSLFRSLCSSVIEIVITDA